MLGGGGGGNAGPNPKPSNIPLVLILVFEGICWGVDLISFQIYESREIFFFRLKWVVYLENYRCTIEINKRPIKRLLVFCIV